MERKAGGNCNPMENRQEEVKPAAEQNGWMFCGLPKNGAEWDWRSAVADKEDEEE